MAPRWAAACLCTRHSARSEERRVGKECRSWRRQRSREVTGPRGTMRAVIVFSAIVLAALLAGACVAYEPALEPVRATGPSDPELVARGARLAAIGNCRGCHTAVNGPALGGGVPLHSPFG